MNFEGFKNNNEVAKDGSNQNKSNEILQMLSSRFTKIHKKYVAGIEKLQKPLWEYVGKNNNLNDHKMMGPLSSTAFLTHELLGGIKYLTDGDTRREYKKYYGGNYNDMQDSYSPPTIKKELTNDDFEHPLSKRGFFRSEEHKEFLRTGRNRNS